MEKINVAEILKDWPKGTKLYSPLCGECYFDRLNMGTIICKKRNTQEISFTSKGYYMLPILDDCECVLFPSKENRDWSKFQRPFKDGDILINGLEDWEYNPFIFKQTNGLGNAQCYCAINCFEELILNSDNWTPIKGCRFATEEEKQKLFDAIKDNGYKWNAETKTLEKLVQPNFKVGNKVRHKSNHNIVFTITSIEEDSYVCGAKSVFWFANQDNYELVPNKFDITTLKPFDKVLVRGIDGIWAINFFGFYDENKKEFPFYCIGQTVTGWGQCIPYEKNEHLLGTTNDCDEYYKNW